ncbi:hypothetical protein [Roseisolibacter agri]|uniref:Uncharacterized protein n=1 Tax=Roseisolibacter agri TaxID=2014610 RepID=A0AA37QED6_9BACT|nr:hypothetical protein [Roseisolibacter agri]GLC25218.1 hypothetical protein rosag_17310 [Roseisolibacter agri]
MSSRPLVYTRTLPGGGFVAIDAEVSGSDHHVRLWVERRADEGRRAGHPPPVIAEAHADDLESAVASLRGIASDNVSVASALRRWQSDRAG